MTVAIQAALVGGALSGLVVLIGVVLAERLRRAGERRRQLERACSIVALRLAVVLLYWSEHPPDARRTETNSEGWHHLQAVLAALTEIEELTRGGRGNAGRINKMAVELDARMFAAQVRAGAGGMLLKHADLFEINARELHGAVFGRRPSADELIKYYVQTGPTAPAPAVPIAPRSHLWKRGTAHRWRA